MNYWITLAVEVDGLTGYRTIKHLTTVPRDAGLKMLEGKEIIRRFKNPFDSSVEVVVIA